MAFRGKSSKKTPQGTQRKTKNFGTQVSGGSLAMLSQQQEEAYPDFLTEEEQEEASATMARQKMSMRNRAQTVRKVLSSPNKAQAVQELTTMVSQGVDRLEWILWIATLTVVGTIPALIALDIIYIRFAAWKFRTDELFLLKIIALAVMHIVAVAMIGALIYYFYNLLFSQLPWYTRWGWTLLRGTYRGYSFLKSLF